MGGLWSRGEAAGEEEEASKGKKRRKPQKGGPAVKTLAKSPLVLRRTSSMYLDEDGHLAHEFYVEQKMTRDQVVRWVMKRVKTTNLVPQGEVELRIPRLHVDYHVVLWENSATQRQLST